MFRKKERELYEARFSKGSIQEDSPPEEALRYSVPGF
jgi:hypothetical protein